MAADKNIVISLQPKQRQLERSFSATSLDAPTTLGYGGALGGGKSAAARRVMLKRRAAIPKTDGVIIRRVYDDLKKNHVDPFFRDFPDLLKYYRHTDHELRLPNGSRILFMFAETEAEVERKFKGPEFYDIMVDQAEQFNEHEIRTIKTRNRWPGAAPGECKTALFFNPGGVGTEYLRRIFWLKQYTSNEHPEDYQFIQAYGWDNFEWFRGLGPTEKAFYELTNEARFDLFIEKTQYGRELNALPQSLRAGHLLGSFESFAGQYFAGVWDESKCIIGPSEMNEIIEPWWTRWGSTDWGFAHHSCHLWYATGRMSPERYQKYFGGRAEWPVDIVIVYRELVANETAETELANTIAAMTAEKMHREFFSPDAFAKRGSANTVAEQFGDIWHRRGLPEPEAADNDRIGGWRFLYNCFRQTVALRGNTITKEQALQGPLLFVGANCIEVQRAIPLLIRDKKRMEDVEKTDTLADDVGDSLRYGIKSMLDPNTRAPRSVHLQKIYESYSDPTTRAIAIKKFNIGETRITTRRRRFR